MKTDQHSTRAARVSDQEPQQWLAIDRVVRDSAAERWLPKEWRGLEEDPLLLMSEQGKRAENQSDDEQRCGHVRLVRGFQRVCMAGNLRQCEFR